MKFRVKLALAKKNDSQKADLGESTHDKIAALPLIFTNVNPALVPYKAAYLAYRAAYENALLGGKPLKAILKVKRDEFISLLKQMAFYVNNIANGDATIITAAGFDTNKAPEARIMTKVVNVQGYTGDHSGEVRFEWDEVVGARLYLGYIRVVGSPVATWELVLKIAGARGVVNGLVPGTLYEFVVEACGFNNVGALSDPVQGRAAF